MRFWKWVGTERFCWINCALPYNRETTLKHLTWHASYADYKIKKVIELIRVSTEAQASTDRASIPVPNGL